MLMYIQKYLSMSVFALEYYPGERGGGGGGGAIPHVTKCRRVQCACVLV